MIGKPLCIKCSEKMYEAGYPVEHRNAPGIYEAVCAGCSRKKRVSAFLMSDTPDHSLVDEIPKWVTASKEGRLFIFPCKKGMTVYTISKYGGSEVRNVHIDAIHVSITGKYENQKGSMEIETLDISDFGKTAFVAFDDAANVQDGELPEETSVYFTEEQLSFFK